MPSDDIRIGTILDGRYRLDEVLGTGAVGAVYRAEHVKLRRPVAVKVLRQEFGAARDLVKRFDREARALSSLDHPNIIAVTDYGVDGGTHYLAMELLEGETLAQRLERGELDPREAITITREMLLALVHAHEHGVLHRDLKPSNVLIVDRPGGTRGVKILDFGMAKLVEAGEESKQPTLTRMGTVLGTPAYMSPEQAAGERADARTDIYSLGILVYQMLTGQRPFVRASAMDLLRAHLVEEVPDPESVRPGLSLSAELEVLLSRSLEKDREDRYDDAAQMLAAVDALPNPAAVHETPGVADAIPVDDDSRSGFGATMTVDSSMIETMNAPARALPTERPSGRLLLAVTACVATVVTAAALWASWGPADVEDLARAPAGDVSPAEPFEAPAGTDAIREEVAQPRAAAVDPFAGAVPRELRRPWRRVRRGRTLDRDAVRDLRAYQREHPGDARPSLLLAHDFYNREWYRDALARYGQACEIDPASRGYRFMLPDLLHLVQTRSHGDAAARLVQHAYGREAVQPIEEALASESISTTSQSKLLRLRDRIRG